MEPRSPSIAASSPDDVAGKNEVFTILVVEDDEDVRAFVTDLLAGRAYRIIEAPNAEQALAIFGTDQHIDLLFTDIVMPGSLNGADLAEIAEQLRPGLKVLYTSGYLGSPAPWLPSVRSRGCFLEKPYRPAQLLERVASLLQPKTAEA